MNNEGRVREWFKRQSWKDCVPQGTASSNLAPSAKSCRVLAHEFVNELERTRRVQFPDFAQALRSTENAKKILAVSNLSGLGFQD